MASQIIMGRSGESASGQASEGGRSLPVAWAILVAGLAIAAGLFFQAVRMPEGFRPAGAIGSLQTVTLTNGTVYFGRMTAVAHDSVVLTDVYEAITNTDPTTKEQVTRLVSRQQADWHGPLDMTIPDDRILFVESIGPESSVGKAIAGSQQAPGGAETKPPTAGTKQP